MKIIRHFWDNLKTETDIWFFYLFLLILPFSIRKVITFFPIRDQFNEYSGIYIYLSDIFLILTLFSWLIILCNKYRLLSIDKLSLIHKDKLWTRLYPQFSPQHFLAYLGLILVLWSFISIFWSDNLTISLFRSIKLLELFLLSIYVAFRVIPQLRHTKCSTWNNLDSNNETVQKGKMFHVEHSSNNNANVPRGTFLKDTFKLLIFGGVINSILAIWQFLAQSSTGLSFLKESVLSSNIDGVAKIILFGHKIIRVYGFFPHPNILGGFLFLSITLTVYYNKLFHVEQLPETGANVPRGTSLSWQNIILTIQIIALILTFSKSAIIGIIITLLYIALVHRHKCSAPAPLNVPRGTLASAIEKQAPLKTVSGTERWTQLFHVEHLTHFLLLIVFLILATISIFPNLSPIQIQSLEQREMLSIVPRGTIDNNPILGIGQGQLVWSMRNNLDLLDWQFQPVHNVFLLIWSELGIVGLILFVLMLWKMFHACPLNSKCSTWNILKLTGVEHLKDKKTSDTQNVPRGTLIGNSNVYPGLQTIFQSILLGLTFIMLFDHYLWDIQQGQMILWIVIGFIYGLSLTDRKKSDIISS